MKIRKAVITAAARQQRTLPLQTLIDRDGEEKSVLAILAEEAIGAGIEEIAVVTCPGDEVAYAGVAGLHARRFTFIPQPEPRGYAHAVYCAREFVGGEPFLQLVGDHLYISGGPRSCAQKLVETAAAESCSVSAVKATRESLLPRFGAVAGPVVAGRSDLYRIETVIEKPTPTEAEQRLIVPGLRAGHYLCFFGMHVFTPRVMVLLADRFEDGGSPPGSLSEILQQLAGVEQYLALEQDGSRFDLGTRYGLWTAQLALAMSGRDRDTVLTQLVTWLAESAAEHPPR
jgi:UTP--glucose-1-phosphate uridylyltransferase